MLQGSCGTSKFFSTESSFCGLCITGGKFFFTVRKQSQFWFFRFTIRNRYIIVKQWLKGIAKWFLMILFRCPSKSKSHATCIFEMEYQPAEQRRKFASKLGEVVFQPSAAVLGLAFSGTIDESTNTGGTSCSGYSSPVASSKQGLYHPWKQSQD